MNVDKPFKLILSVDARFEGDNIIFQKLTKIKHEDFKQCYSGEDWLFVELKK